MPKRLCDLKADLSCDQEFCREYDALEESFTLARELIKARSRAGLSQEQVAERMGVPASTVARMESGGPAPGMALLAKYARAAGCALSIRLDPCE
jgi:DNA-binding XRE family transcriptional regulator